MACHRFVRALKARALGVPLDADAAAHLAVCSKCQETLDLEEHLVATIDGALDDVRSVRPSHDFGVRLRMHLDHSHRSTVDRWIVAAVAAGIAILIAGVGMDRWGREGTVVRKAAPDVVKASVDPRAEGRREILEKAPTLPLDSRARAARVLTKAHPLVQTSQVLVPAKERQAIARLFDSLRAGRLETVTILMSLQRGSVVTVTSNELTVPPIQIDPVAISVLPLSPPVQIP